MQRSVRAAVRVFLAAAAIAMAAAGSAHAQGRGGGGPPPGGGMGGPGGPGGGGMNGGPMGGPGFPQGPGSPGGGIGRGAPEPGMEPTPSAQGRQTADTNIRPGLQLGPPGRWWDDKSFAKSLKLRSDQQTRMDAIFEQNRAVLTARFQGLQQAEAQMDEVSRSPEPDESALFAQIDHVAQARAELDKANTHMLLQIRREMDADQIARLEKHH
jgi:Spy/CpxP family protein refolding chaperone